MLKSLKSFLSLVFIFLGIYLVLSSDYWLVAWFGLEVSVLAFTPLLILEGRELESEAALKYFLVQAVASVVFVVGGVFSSDLKLGVVMVLLALVMKLGLAPLHFWLPQVVGSASWISAYCLLTIQKISPLVLLCWLGESHQGVLIMVGGSSALVGGVGGLNEVSIKKVLTFSSINHFGWVISALAVDSFTGFFYFGFYTVLLAGVVFPVSVLGLVSLESLSSEEKEVLPVSVAFLSLGGVPPMAGFFPKLVAVGVIGPAHLILTSILLGSSVLSLFYYSRCFFTSSAMKLLKSGRAWYGRFAFLSAAHMGGGLLLLGSLEAWA